MEFVRLAEKRAIVAHFHEWLVGVGLIRLKQMGVPIATVFTTHATLLGRWLAAGRVDLYNVIHHLNADEEAGRRGIYHKHWIEVGATRGADIFTTGAQAAQFCAHETENALPSARSTTSRPFSVEFSVGGFCCCLCLFRWRSRRG